MRILQLMSVVLFGALALPPAPARADGAEVEARIADVHASFVELAETFHKRNLKAHRDEVAEAILERDPDQPDARKWLGYERGADGGWERSPRWKPGTNRNRAAERRVDEIRADVMGKPADALFRAYEQHRASISAELRVRTLQVLIEARPDHARYREEAGEQQHDGRWVLDETVRAIGRRAALRELVQQALAQVKDPEEAPPHAHEKPLAAWTSGARTSRHRVLGTGGQAEALTVVTHMDALESVLRGLLRDDEVDVPSPLTSMLLRDRAEKDAVVDALDLSPAETQKKKRAAANWVSPKALVIGFDDDAGRLDATLRMLTQATIRRNYRIPHDEDAWLFEGFGLYMTYTFVGTHRCFMFGDRSRYDGEEVATIRSHLTSDTVDWLAEAHRVDAEGNLPELVYVMGVGLNDLTAADVLSAYAFAAYLVEGREEPIAPLLHAASGDAGRFHTAVAKHLGATLPQLDARVRRWLAETTRLRRR